MSQYRIEGLASHTLEPIVKVALTASEALTECRHLIRVCGKYGKVIVYGKDGRQISSERLRSLARVEDSSPPDS